MSTYTYSAHKKNKLSGRSDSVKTERLYNLKPENTLFVPGLWLNPTGQLAAKIGEDATVLDILGIPNIGLRILKLVNYLEGHPEVTNLVGHSAGCYVIAEAIRCGLCRSVKKIVLLNPAPMPGTKFSPKDLVFWLLAKPSYLWRMITGKDIQLSRGDTKRLLSLTEEQVAELTEGNSLVADSGVFMRRIVLNQFAEPWDGTLVREDVAFTIVTADHDKMVDSTSRRTNDVLCRNYRIPVVIHIPGGHLFTLRNFKDTVGRILKDYKRLK